MGAAQFSAGTTFINAATSGVPSHLWILASDPNLNDKEIVIVNVTTARPGADPSCPLKIGDHPFISHDSLIYYAKSRLVSLPDLLGLLEKNQISLHFPASPELLANVQKGFSCSQFAPRECKRILREQGIV